MVCIVSSSSSPSPSTSWFLVGSVFESSAASSSVPLSLALTTGGAPNPLKEPPPNEPLIAGANAEVVAAGVVGAASAVSVFGGAAAPNPNPTGLPKLPLFGAPKPLKEEVPFGGLALPPDEEPKRVLLPKGLAVAGLLGALKGLDMKLPPPPKMLEDSDLGSVLISLSLSLAASCVLLFSGLPNSEGLDEGNALELEPNAEVGFGAESPAGFGCEEKKLGMEVVEPNEDLGGLAGGAAVEDGKENPLNDEDGAGVKPPPPPDEGTLKEAIGLPPNVKLEGGVGNVAGGFGAALLPFPNSEDDEDGTALVASAAGAGLDLSSNSF